MAGVTWPAQGIELHWKPCPPEERGAQFVLCYSDHPGVWYAQRGYDTFRGAVNRLNSLRRGYGYTRPLWRFRIWDTTGPWPDA